MATISVEGTLEIDMVDVYAWLEKEGYTKGVTVSKMEFDIEEDALVLERENGKGPIHVDSVDLWTWVIDKQMPKDMAPYETCFGVPEVDGSLGVLKIDFASSNTCDPRSWATPPACLAQWDNKRTAKPSPGP